MEFLLSLILLAHTGAIQNKTDAILLINILFDEMLWSAEKQNKKLVLKSAGMFEAELFWIFARNTRPLETESVQVDTVSYLLRTNENSYV